jgi:hypothetical protein
VLEWMCHVSPLVSGSVSVFIGLLALAFRAGGTVEKISLPGVFEVKLNAPYTIPQTPRALYYSLGFFACAAALYSLPLTGACTLCSGMPGQTAWIYVGQYDPTLGKFVIGPFVRPEKSDERPENIDSNEWVPLNEPLKTMILDYNTRGLMRALDSPFILNGMVNYTCKVLLKGQRLYVAQRDMNGPSANVQHLWLRVRMAPPGAALQ